MQPADQYLREAELKATVCGRYRGDARRLDAYVSYDPLDIDLEKL